MRTLAMLAAGGMFTAAGHLPNLGAALDVAHRFGFAAAAVVAAVAAVNVARAARARRS